MSRVPRGCGLCLSIVWPAFAFAQIDWNSPQEDCPPVAAGDAFQRAFPTAEGFGAFSRGGRGGQVVYVTTLADYGAGEPVVVGSLRWALEELRCPRTVLFKVGGNIALTRRLILTGESGSFVTIAGQTAPGDGIQLTRWGLVVANGAHDVIVRYLRIRVGYSGPEGASIKDCITLIGDDGRAVRNVVVDHCSLEWAIDENVGVGDAVENVTFQWCILGEGAVFGHENDGGNSAGMLLSGAAGLPSDKYLTIHHCLFINNRSRNPSLTQNGGLVELVNNYICNYPVEGTKLWPLCSLSPRANIIGNVYAFGGRGVRPVTAHRWQGREIADAALYVVNNLSPITPTLNGDNWENVGDAATSQTLSASKRRSNPWPVASHYHIVADSPLLFADQILSHAGASYPHWDVVDQRLIAEAETGAGDAGFGHSIQDHESWPVLAGGIPYPDWDGDGMTGPWERAHGLNPGNPADGPADLDGDGYTNLEEFLNELVGE